MHPQFIRFGCALCVGCSALQHRDANLHPITQLAAFHDDSCTSTAVVKALGELLENEDRATRVSAARRLRDLGAVASSELPKLIRASAKDREVRDIACELLMSMSDGGLRHLIKATKSSEKIDRLGALRLLGSTGLTRLVMEKASLPDQQWESITNALQDKESEVRVEAAEILMEYCDHTKDWDRIVVGALIDRLRE